MRRLCRCLPVLCVLVACAADHSAQSPSDAAAPDADKIVPTRPPLCDRQGASAVRDVFCADTPPVIHSLRDLNAALKLGFPDGSDESPDAASPASSGPSFQSVAVLGHSTSLSAQLISPINPRVLIIGADTIIAFNRGVQQVEIADRDPNTSLFEFFLVSFEQACNAPGKHCGPGDLYTPALESNWLDVKVRDSEDLKNTPLDCRQCHQRGRDEPILLMRELRGPWTHFFGPESGPDEYPPEPSGVTLTREYVSAKGDESYGGVPAEMLRESFGFALQARVPFVQPLVFDAQKILSERWPIDADGNYPAEPQKSATWYAAYESFKRGEQLAPPYFEPRVADVAKQAKLTSAYQQYRDGVLAAAELPDLSDIFPDDPQVRAEIGLQTEPGATPAQALVQACGPCHNDVLDQSISRARFNIALSKMSRAQLDNAIARIEAPRESPIAMPPDGTRQLDKGALARLVDYLKQDVRSAEDNAFLKHAAEQGMAGGGEYSDGEYSLGSAEP